MANALVESLFLAAFFAPPLIVVFSAFTMAVAGRHHRRGASSSRTAPAHR